MTKNNDNLVKNLADKIAEQIMCGERMPGTRLRQEVLAEEFAVSRTPVREALRHLESRGLIEHVPNHGATVSKPSSQNIREAYQVRAELEGLAAELAVEWITDEQIALLHEAQARFSSVVETLIPVGSEVRRPVDEGRDWISSNTQFHDVILTAARNSRLKSTVNELHSGFTRNIMMSAATMDGRAMRENVAQHDAIIRAIEQNDGELARRAMRHHVLRSGELAIWWLEHKGILS